MSFQENMNAVASANRLHISFFGCRNAGKSSLVNRVTEQDLAVVSDVKGTTTDPVTKAMELLPLGPVVIIDTPGFDDEGELGELRVRRTKQVINNTDIAVLVVDAAVGMREEDRQLLSMFKRHEIPYILVWNKADIRADDSEYTVDAIDPDKILYVSSKTGQGIEELKEKLGNLAKEKDDSRTLLDGIVKHGDTVILVVPIDKAAPKGRLIMPQQMAIRSALDIGAAAVVTRETELKETLERLKDKPSIVITDSQAFSYVSGVVPGDVPLTSFSILMARYKGTLINSIEAVQKLDHLSDGDTILMAEGCTHHRQCGDIGTVKIPQWLRKYSGKDIKIETSSGRDFPEDLRPYAAVIHCGGCMNTERDMRYRMRSAMDQGIPFTNYGIVIAKMTGILERSIKVIPELKM